MNSYAHFELDKNYIEQPVIFLKVFTVDLK
jgi:hypothetical protein